MGNGCCCCCQKKVAPLPVPVVTTTEVVDPKLVPKDKPYGYVRLFAGARTGENTYASPVIALHTYVAAREVTTRTKAIVNIPNGSTNTNVSSRGPSTSTNIDRRAIEERVRCIPVEDIISIEYSTDVKKEYETFETTQERPRAQKPKLGCCGRMKQCLRETFCCCPKCPCKVCKRPPVEQPQYQTDRRQNVKANRMILVEMRCVQHANINIPSHVQVLPNEEKNKFYLENFKIDPIQFYLVNNNEPDENIFEVKRHQAETFARIIIQLRNMAHHYPSAAELDGILRQEQAAIFGDEIRE